MNIRKVKRLSRRAISLLLTIMMVFSLFTVSILTASAYFDFPSGKNIIFDPQGTTAQSWENVYFVIGRDNNDNNGHDKYTSCYSMTKSGNQWKLDNFSGWDIADQYFFTSTDKYSSNNTNITGAHQVYSEVYLGIDNTQKTKTFSGVNAGGGLTISGNNYTYELSAKGEATAPVTPGTFPEGDKIIINQAAASGDWNPDNWTDVYMVIGNNTDASATKIYKMQPTGTAHQYTTEDTTEGSGFNGFDGFSYYFFIDGATSVGKKIDDIYNALQNYEKTDKYDTVTSGGTTTLNDVRLKSTTTENFYPIAATLYNYRSNTQINQAKNNTSGLTDYEIDSHNDKGYNSGAITSVMTDFDTYNKAVGRWFNGVAEATPLYEGNFMDLGNNESAFQTYADTYLYHFIRVANGANRAGRDRAAIDLVDKRFVNGTIAQKGKELPQFSDSFMTANPNVQSKYDKLKFDMHVTNHGKGREPVGNTWYRYNADSDGNRWLDVDVGRVRKGSSIANPLNGKKGFFPFNTASSSDLTKTYGAKFEVEFYMTADGTSNDEALQFNFEGDDDVWVFIDGYLMLDLGGSHGITTGKIDLSHADGTITSTVDKYYHSSYKTIESSHRFDQNIGGSIMGTNLTTTYSASSSEQWKKDAYAKITDTNITHKMTIFYMERGLYDSNLYMEFMLPQYDTLTLLQNVDAQKVNPSIRKETMKIVADDGFNTNISTKNMAAAANGKNPAHLPIHEDFTRKQPDSTTLTLQAASTGDPTTVANSASGSTWQGVNAYYSWEDHSKTVDPNGNFTDINAASGEGVGIPKTKGDDGGYVPLLYGQSATFYQQFQISTSTGTNGYIKITHDNDLYSIKNSQDNGRNRSTYYDTTTMTVYDNKKKTITLGSEGEFTYNNTTIDTSPVKITAEVMNVVKAGTLSFKKEVEASLGTTYTTTKEYKFRLRYKDLYGKSGKDGILSNFTSMDGSTQLTDDDGYFYLKNNDTITFEGIPVGTKIVVEEIIEGTDVGQYEIIEVTGAETSDSTSLRTPAMTSDGITTVAKNGDIVKAITFVLNEKVNTDNVNSGLKSAVMDVANKDVFDVKLQTTAQGSPRNGASLPISTDFIRSEMTLQQASTGTVTTILNPQTTSSPAGANVTASYDWTDTSNRATGSGTGVPDNGVVGLQFDQTATFKKQFMIDTSADNNVITFNQQTDLKSYTDSYNTYNIRNTDTSGRTVSNYYTTSYTKTLTNCTDSNSSQTNSVKYVVPDQNLPATVQVDIENTILVGKIAIKKTIDNKEKDNRSGDFYFRLYYKNLFGDSTDNEWHEANQWTAESDKGRAITTTADGKFPVANGETLTFTGIPVDTKIKIVEITNDGSAIKEAIWKDKDNDNVAQITYTSDTVELTKAIGLVANDATNNNGTVTVKDTLQTVPVLYRFYDRNMDNDVEASTNNYYTYFVKFIPGVYSDFLTYENDAVTGISSEGKATVAQYSPSIDSALCKYTLSASTSNFALRSLATTDTRDIAYAVSKDALTDKYGLPSDQNKNYISYENSNDCVIQATYDNTVRQYSVKALFHNGTSKVALGYDTPVKYDYNTNVSGVKSPIVIHVGGTDYAFAYWERKLNTTDEDDHKPVYTPVSTNYSYIYRVMGDLELRAVYKTFGSKRGTRYVFIENSDNIQPDGPFVPFAGGVFNYEYHRAGTHNYTLYYEIGTDNVKRYLNNATPAEYTIEANETIAQYIADKNVASLRALGIKVDETVSEATEGEYMPYEAKSYCLPNLSTSVQIISGNETVEKSDLRVGHSVSAGDVVYNTYTVQVTENAETENEKHVAQDRARVDVMLGAVGSYDSDTAAGGISKVGYLLFQSYKSGGTVIAPTPSAVGGSLQALATASVTNGKIAYPIPKQTTGINQTNFNCLTGVYTVVPGDANTSGNSGASGGSIHLTNKNRMDIMFDLANTETIRSKQFLCYTYMERGGTIYISPDPVTFCIGDVGYQYPSTDPVAEKDYTLSITNRQNKGGLTIGDLGNVVADTYNFVDNKDITLIINRAKAIKDSNNHLYDGKLTSLIISGNAGTTTLTAEELEAINNGTTNEYTFHFTASNYLSGDNTALQITAVFEPKRISYAVTTNAYKYIDNNYDSTAATALGTVTTNIGATDEVVDGDTVKINLATLVSGTQTSKLVGLRIGNILLNESDITTLLLRDGGQYIYTVNSADIPDGEDTLEIKAYFKEMYNGTIYNVYYIENTTVTVTVTLNGTDTTVVLTDDYQTNPYQVCALAGSTLFVKIELNDSEYYEMTNYTENDFSHTDNTTCSTKKIDSVPLSEDGEPSQDVSTVAFEALPITYQVRLAANDVSTKHIPSSDLNSHTFITMTEVPNEVVAVTDDDDNILYYTVSKKYIHNTGGQLSVSLTDLETPVIIHGQNMTNYQFDSWNIGSGTATLSDTSTPTTTLTDISSDVVINANITYPPVRVTLALNNIDWSTASAKIYVYAFRKDNSTGNISYPTWVLMNEFDTTNHKYEADVPVTCNRIIFVRCQPSVNYTNEYFDESNSSSSSTPYWNKTSAQNDGGHYIGMGDNRNMKLTGWWAAAPA